MTDNKNFDVIIIGGSYSGLAAAMALGRALRKVLVIDDGKPCNRQTPYSHNFLTNDGKAPAEIAAIANLQVARYNTIQFFDGTVIQGHQLPGSFEIEVATGEIFTAGKLIFATGIKDQLPGIEGFAACWGISVIHCPYCHGYEVKGKKTGVLGNGETGFDFTRLIANWTADLTLFTNGVCSLTSFQMEKLTAHAIVVIEKEIDHLDHQHGQLEQIVFKDGSIFCLDVLYAPAPFEQKCTVPELIGCELTTEGYLKIDPLNETTVAGIYATGDNAAKMRTVANAVAMGTSVGITLSKKMILEQF